MKRSISVFGQKYKVKLTKKAQEDGLIDFNSKTIIITQSKSVQSMWESFWHEACHAYQWRMGRFHDGTPIDVLEREAETMAQFIKETIDQLAPDFHDGK